VYQYCIALPKLTDTVLVRNRNRVALASFKGMHQNMDSDSTIAHNKVTASWVYMSVVTSCIAASNTHTTPEEERRGARTPPCGALKGVLTESKR